MRHIYRLIIIQIILQLQQNFQHKVDFIKKDLGRKNRARPISICTLVIAEIMKGRSKTEGKIRSFPFVKKLVDEWNYKEVDSVTINY